MEEKNLKYQELIHYINNLIETGELKPGDKVYSENKLVSKFGISRQTVRHALEFLEEEGKIFRVRGSGTFVSDPHMFSRENRNRIAVVTTYVESYIFPKTIQGIEQELFEKGYSVQIAFTNNTVERERSVLQDIINRDDVAGVIVEATKSGLPNPNIHLYKCLQQKRIPILFINAFYPEIDAPHVCLDDAEAARKAVNYLIGKGHTQIGAVLKLDDGQGRMRYLGYIKAMKEAGLPISDSRMVWIDTDDSHQLSLGMDKLLSRVERCTALFCYNDQVAYQLVKLLKERGIRVPEDISLIGIDDSDLARMSEVPITSLPHPKEKLGAMAARNLLELIENPKYNATYEFETRVVERESVAETDGHKQ